MEALAALQSALSVDALRAALSLAEGRVSELPALESEMDAAQTRLAEMTLAAGALEGAAASDEVVSATAEAAWPPTMTASQAHAVELTAAELIAATEGFAEERKIGKGGFGSVYVANALPSLTPLAPRLAASGHDLGFALPRRRHRAKTAALASR
eukprot:6227614-Prymnesium_polylepis.1